MDTCIFTMLGKTDDIRHYRITLEAWSDKISIFIDNYYDIRSALPVCQPVFHFRTQGFNSLQSKFRIINDIFLYLKSGQIREITFVQIGKHINLPHHISAKQPHMPAADRAAQFAPFAALTGYGEVIKETARLTDRRAELDEDTRAMLDLKQQILAGRITEQPEVSVVWFCPDRQKDGGQYVTTAGRLKKVDNIGRVLRLADGTAIPLDDVLELWSDCFRGIFQDR